MGRSSLPTTVHCMNCSLHTFGPYIWKHTEKREWMACSKFELLMIWWRAQLKIACGEAISPSFRPTTTVPCGRRKQLPWPRLFGKETKISPSQPACLLDSSLLRRSDGSSSNWNGGWLWAFYFWQLFARFLPETNKIEHSVAKSMIFFSFFETREGYFLTRIWFWNKRKFIPMRNKHLCRGFVPTANTL